MLFRSRAKKISRQYQEAIAEANYTAFQEAEKKRVECKELAFRRLIASEVEDALALAENVFLETIAKNLPAEMTEVFRDQLIHNPSFVEDYKNGICKIYGATTRATNKIVGVLALNKDSSRICLLFVDQKHAHKKVATKLIDTMLAESEQICELTVNSPAEAEGFFKAYGFEQAADKVDNGEISYTPMCYAVGKRDKGSV